MKEIAIIGPTASGKSDLAIQLARKTGAFILSIDSLSIYKEIDIISAKPTKNERSLIPHFGIDALKPDEHFSVHTFLEIYKDAKQICMQESKDLLIVGGTSFYLKALIDGLSELPKSTPKVQEDVQRMLLDLQDAYKLLFALDPKTMQAIAPNDSYRIEKMLFIYRASGLTPSEWFALHPPAPVITDLSIYNIEVSRELLCQRITKRTAKMLEMGALDEVATLEQKYTRLPNAMKSIGIVEILEYFDGKVDFTTMQQNITTHTAQLAKRQQTFNKTQFKNIFSASAEDLYKKLLN